MRWLELRIMTIHPAQVVSHTLYGYSHHIWSFIPYMARSLVPVILPFAIPK